ncbi:hypothetical protein J7E32_17775 [Bacillus sp. ISL-55]|nr:hypothetical protein [Bacillus sp. ISL-55]
MTGFKIKGQSCQENGFTVTQMYSAIIESKSVLLCRYSMNKKIRMISKLVGMEALKDVP